MLFDLPCSFIFIFIFICIFVGVLTAAAEAVRSGKPVERRSTYSAPWILDSKLLSVISTEKKNAKTRENLDDVLTMYCVPNILYHSSLKKENEEFYCFIFVKFSPDKNDRFFSYEKVCRQIDGDNLTNKKKVSSILFVEISEDRSSYCFFHVLTFSRFHDFSPLLTYQDRLIS